MLAALQWIQFVFIYILSHRSLTMLWHQKLRLFTFEIIDHLSCCSLQWTSTLPHNVFKSFCRWQQVVYLVLQSGVFNLQSLIVCKISCEIRLCNERYVNDNIINCRQFHKTLVGKQFLFNFLLSIFILPPRIRHWYSLFRLVNLNHIFFAYYDVSLPLFAKEKHTFLGNLSSFILISLHGVS